MLRISKVRVLWCLLSVIASEIAICCAQTQFNENILYIVSIPLALIFVCCLYSKENKGTYLTYPVILFLAFYIFSFGQNVLMAFGYNNGDFFNIYSLNTQLRMEASFYTMRCIYLFGIGMVLGTRRSKSKEHNYDAQYDLSQCNSTVLNCIFFSIAFIIVAIDVFLFIYSIFNGYTGMRVIREQLVNVSIYSLIDFMFFPLGIMKLLTSKPLSLEHKLTIYLLVIWGIITALSGDRTTGMAALLVLFIARETLKIKRERKKRRNILSYVVIIAVVLFAVSFLEQFRNLNSREFMKQNGLFSSVAKNNFVFSSIAEMGGSFMPLAWIMELVPNSIAFLNGKTYLGALIGFFPSSIDFTGIIQKWTTIAVSLAPTIVNQKGFTWGTGSSLIAESYYNFGSYGIIVLLIEGFLIARLLCFGKGSIRQKSLKMNTFNRYVQIALFFNLITAPRRDIFYVVNSVFYVVVIGYILYSLTVKEQKKCNGNGEMI